MAAAIAILVMVLPAFVGLTRDARAQAPAGAFVDEVVFFEQVNSATALEQVSKGGEMQVYMFDLRNIPDKQAALADPNIRTAQTPANVIDLFINPVQFVNPAPGVSEYNIFVNQDIRQAMNWLVDRDFIIERMYGGFGIPYISPWHARMPEYVREAAFFQNLDTEYSYNPTLARETIHNALSGIPGMEFQGDGKWYYRDQPLTVRFVIRTEDLRLDIGDYVADQIESLGITVLRDFKPAGEAFACVYFGNPTSGCWSLYTELFGFRALVPWQDDWISRFYTPHGGETIWDFYTPPATLVDVSNRLRDGQYVDLADRQSLLRQGSALAVEDGVRVWLTAEKALFIFNSKITGAVYDLMSGPWGLFTIRTARYATDGGSLRIGQPTHFSSFSNPVRGFTWLYDATLRHAFADPAIGRHPYTGNPLSVRAAYAVQTAGPGEQLVVDPGTQVWDTATSAWVNVPLGARATSKVTFDYTFGKWHDGSDMSMDDVLVMISHYYRLQNGDGFNAYTGAPYPTGDLGAIDPHGNSPAINRWMSQFKGLRVVDEDSLDVYVDYWHLQPDEIAAVASVWPTEPWTAWELMAKAVLDNEARYDARSARTGNCPSGCAILDLTKGPTLGLLTADVATLRASNHVPAGFFATITPAEAAADWMAIDNFRLARGHFYVSNGPFSITRVDAASKQAFMARFADYPYPADRWDAMLHGRVPRLVLGDVTTLGVNRGVVVPGLPATVQVHVTVEGQPYGRASLDYVVIDVGTGESVATGKPTPTTTAGTWAIEFSAADTSLLTPGIYEIRVFGTGEESAIPTSTTTRFAAIPQAVFFEGLIGQVTDQIGSLRNDLDQAQADLDAASAHLAALRSLSTTALLIAVVGVAVAVTALVFVRVRVRRHTTSGPKGPADPPN